jgi:hypothetical protein
MVMKKRLLVTRIFFGIIMAKVNSAQNKKQTGIKKMIFKMHQIKGTGNTSNRSSYGSWESSS